VLKRIDLRSCPDVSVADLPRARVDVEAAVAAVAPIVADVHARGAEAVRAATEKFDGVTLKSLRVPAEAIRAAAERLDPAVAAGLRTAIAHARMVHAAGRRHDVTIDVVPGGTVTQTWRPVRRVGLYVPGGRAVYPSSVVMNVVPAQLAGVVSIALASPPQRDTGQPHELVLAACALLGVDEVYAAGGAQAIAMFAHGTETAADEDDRCERVDVITGPGNIYVTAAKRLVRGLVGIDAEAGPTEIAILADETADPRHVAADLVSQAEHDPLAASVLVTTSTALADAVDALLPAVVAATKHRDRVTEALAGEQSATILVASLADGLAVVNAYAAEHLEIQTRDARAVAGRVTSAGAVFVGAFTPVSLGDYVAGSNHVLPTGGCARHAGGLSVQSFLKGMQVIEYTEEALAGVAAHVVALADAEDLPAHGEAVVARRKP
jgi:histidinol dehydrogenase